MKWKAPLRWFLAICLLLFVASPPHAQVTFSDFTVLGCQGGPATAQSTALACGVPNGPTCDGSGNLITHTSNPSFGITAAENTGSTAGLIGETSCNSPGNVTCIPLGNCSSNTTCAALPTPSTTDLPTLQDLWTFDGNGNDSAGGMRNLTYTGFDGGGNTCGVAPTISYVNAKNHPQTPGFAGDLGSAFQTDSGGGSCPNDFAVASSANEINFSAFASFTVETWLKWAGQPTQCFEGVPCAAGTGGTCTFGGGLCVTNADCGIDGPCINQTCPGVGAETCPIGTCTFGGAACESTADCPFSTPCSAGTVSCTNAGCNTNVDGDSPILVNCQSGTTDHCLHIVARDCTSNKCNGGGAGTNCGTSIAGTIATPYFAFFGDDVCGGDLTDHNWHHLAFVANGGNKTIYEDGVVVASTAISGTQAPYAGSGVDTEIGGVAYGHGEDAGFVTNGAIDSLRIWGSALDGDIIESHAMGQWFSIAGDLSFNGGLSGIYNPSGVGPETPQNPPATWVWGFGLTRNIIPGQGSTDTPVTFKFAEEDTNEFIGESSLTVDVEQATMSIPPNPTMILPTFNQSHLSYEVGGSVTPSWFCDTANTSYEFGVGNCTFGDCSGITPSAGALGTTKIDNLSNLCTNNRYDINVAATYQDVGGDGVTVGPSPVTPSTAAATLAWPPDVPTALTTTGPGSVSLTINLTESSKCTGFPTCTNTCPSGGFGAGPFSNPTWTATKIQGSVDNGGTWFNVSGFESFINPMTLAPSSPRAVNGLSLSSKYIFRSENESLDGFPTCTSCDTFNNTVSVAACVPGSGPTCTSGAGAAFAVTEPETPAGFTGTSAQGTPGLTCPKTQVLWSWNSVPIGSNQPPATVAQAAVVPLYLLLTQGNVSINGGSTPNCAGCQTTLSFLQGGPLDPNGPLTPGTVNTGKVFALNSGAPLAPPALLPDGIRFSGPSQLGSVQTAPGAILAPTGVGGQSLVGAILWSWNAPPNLCFPSSYTVTNAVTGALTSPNGLNVNPFHNFNSVVTYTESPLGPNQEASIRVSATDGGPGGVAGDVPSPLSASATNYSQAFPPINITFTGISTGGIVVNWSGNGNPSYTRYEVSESTFNLFANHISTPYQISNNLTSDFAPLTALNPGTTYYIRVRAFNGQHNDGSGTVFTSFVSGAVMTLFSAPTVTGTALSNTEIDWYWPTIGVSSPSGYQIVQTPPGGTPTASYLPPTYAFPGTLHYTVTNLNTNTQYGIQVYAINGQGLSSPSPLVDIYTLAVNPIVTLGNDIVGVTSNTITYQWGPSLNPVRTFYEVDVATNQAYNMIVTTVTPPTTAITIAGLFPLTTYFAMIRAYNGDLIPTFAGPGPGTLDGYVLFDSTRTNGDLHVSISSSPPTVYQTANGAVGQWHFDEDAGTISADFSGFVDSAALTCLFNGCVSTPTWTAGPPGLGSAVNLSGQTSSFVLVNDAPQFHFITPITLEAWVQPAPPPAPPTQINGAGIIAKGAINAEDFFLDVFNGKFRFSGCSGSGGAATSAQSIVPGQWTHVAATWGAGTNTIYINGVAAGSGACPSRSFSTNPTPGANVSIGNRYSPSGGYDLGFNGYIDEVRIISGLSSAAQIKQDYLSAFGSTVTLLGANNGLGLVVPPNAFGGPATIYASNDPVNHPLKISVPELMNGLANEPTRQLLIPGMFVEIVPIVNGAQFTGPLGSTVTILMPYNDPNNTGLIQGFSPSIAVNTLKVYTYNTSVGAWQYLPTTVDSANRRLLIQTPHFSTFGAFGTAATGGTTTEARIYPVPWKQGSGGPFDAPSLTFDTLPPQGTIRIFTLAGLKVVDLPFYATNAGTVQWNGANSFGKPVASGVYFAVITTTDGSTRALKFAIER